MIILQLSDIEILFNTIQDLYNYQLTRADKDKILAEITKRAENTNPRISNQINISLSKNIIITYNEYGKFIGNLKFEVTNEDTNKQIPITFKFYQIWIHHN